GEVLATCDAGARDGVRVDTAGRIWGAAHGGLHVPDPDGTLLGRLLLPEVCSNLTFGGPKRNVLYVTATHLLLSGRTTATGLRCPPPSAAALDLRVRRRRAVQDRGGPATQVPVEEGADVGRRDPHAALAAEGAGLGQRQPGLVEEH